ncbi:YveK family protein [Alkalicoccus luteus]|uniref:Capsular biosynthesis protein n=1 Tax=Alkalicoccus luteus TaxID=1237094 RepID=A0A969PXJ5_9BACI|nr:Wzz/FepE/Etk N-terminal domain-containing protein [Alkalicoccus luteus]NJP37442.1 capsular biosynthesis protein [Alkalicoccus luteus]
MEETISLKEIIQTIRQRLIMIISITLAAVAIAAGVSYFVLTPMYSASTQILVNQSTEGENVFTQNDIRTNVELINTYNVIMTSPRILEPTIDELNLEQGVGTLRNQVNVSAEGESQVVTVTVEDANPASAVEIANTMASVFQQDIIEIMNVDNVSILSAAELSDNPSPVSPNPTLNMAIAFVVGLMASVGLAFLLAFLDRTIKTEDDVEEKLGIPVLASISTMNTSDMEESDLSHTRRGKGRETYGA